MDSSGFVEISLRRAFIVPALQRGDLEFGHSEEQFPWVDPHPVRRPADHPLPKGEGEIHGLDRWLEGPNRRFMTQWQRRDMKRRSEPHPQLLFSLSLRERVARSDG